MYERTITFDGYEIDTILDFLDLIASPKDRPDQSDPQVWVNQITCHARATILSDEDKTKVTHRFKAIPDRVDDGYQRTLRFRIPNQDKSLEFGGRNAVREEWRLDTVSFDCVTNVPAFDHEEVQLWIKNILKGNSSAADGGEEFITNLRNLRLFLMGAYDCNDRGSVINHLKEQLSLILQAPFHVMSEDEKHAIGGILCDLGDKEFIQKHAGALKSKDSLSGRHLPTLLRHLFAEQYLGSGNSLSTIADELMNSIVGRLRNISKTSRWAAWPGTGSSDPDDLKQLMQDCAVVLEALSFAASVQDRLHKEILEALDHLSVIQDRLAGKTEQKLLNYIASALAAGMLCYARLYQSAVWRKFNLDMFKGAEARSRTLILKRMQRRISSPADVTQQIAGMASLALITKPAQSPGAFKAIISAIKAATKPGVGNEGDRSAAVAAGADACGLLFTLRTPRDEMRARRRVGLRDTAAAAIAEYWDNTSNSVVRRACARNLSEALYNGVAPYYILDRITDSSHFSFVARTMLPPKASSLKYYRASGSNDPIQIDLPSQALLLALDDWSLLPRLVCSEEYEGHSDCKKLSTALRRFALAERDAAVDIQAAREEFFRVAAEIRALPADFLPRHLTSELAQGIEARGEYCRLSDRDNPLDQAIAKAATASAIFYESLSKSTENTSNPDYWLAASFKHLFEGVASSRYWEGASGWSQELTQKFSKALQYAAVAGSRTYYDFCKLYVEPLRPNTIIPAALGSVAESSGAMPPLELPSPGPLEFIFKSLAFVGQFVGRIFAHQNVDSLMPRVDTMVTHLKECRLRPVGIIKVSRALQW